jgi:anti-sigma-K factor RskA
VNCNDVDDVIGAYAIDALPDAEAREVRAHLRGCLRHAAKAQELRLTAARLAATAEPLPPPAALRSRILAAVADSPQAAATAPVSIDTARDQTGRAYPSRAWAVAAVAAAAFAGLFAWNVVLLNRGGEDSVERLASRARIVATLDAQGVQGGGVVLYFPGEKKALVVGDGMQRLDPKASTYQLWEIDGDQPKSIGLMEADVEGHGVAVVPFEGGQAHTLAITIEPPGGSIQPTSNPIFVAKV